jgi:hypothetical protein
MTKILFIMFQGGHSNLKTWNEYTESKFLDKLKKLGDVYTYQDKTYNIWYYDKTHPEYKDYDPDIDIDLSYVIPDKHIKIVYDDILLRYKNIDEYKLIPIGWSLGCWLALYFAQVYSSKCSHVILLESSLFTPNNMKIRLDDLASSNLKDLQKWNEKSITNAKYKEMLQNWKTNNSNIEDANKIRDINTYIRALFISNHLNLTFSVPTLAFFNLKKIIKDDDLIKNKQKKDEVKILQKLNPTNYKAYFFINTSHYIFDKERPASKIIKKIKKIIKN